MKKNKQKTHKSVLKRFKVTKSGKILHRGHGMRHLKHQKTKKRLRHLKQIKEIKGRFKRKIKKIIGY
jgi:large subunit ribosomal protein L35